jgi:hypothetical protein
VRELVDHARRELLAAAGRAGDHDAAVGRRDPLDELAQMVHDRGRAHQPGALPALLPELLDLTLQARGLERALGDQDQAVRLERLLDVVVGPALDGRDRGLDIAVPGDHDDRQVRVLALDDVEKLQAVEPASLQPDVQEHQRGPAQGDGGQRFLAVPRRARAVTLVLEEARDQLADVRLVVNDQNVGRHASPALHQAFATRAASGP